MKQRCKRCNKEEDKIRAEKIKKGSCPYGSYRFRDNMGRRWEGLNCPSCTLELQTVRRHARGRCRFTNPIPIHAKGIASENVLKEVFLRSGYEVKQSSLQGPDLILSKGGRTYTCEVKSAIKCANANSWYAAPVSKFRREDDLIAVVFDEDNFIIEPMEAYQLQCSISGRRNFTDEARSIFGIDP